MKKNYFFLLIFLCSGLISLAQPIITSADIINYSVIAHDVPNVTGITTGNAGANQTWDYSALVPAASTNHPDISATTVPVSSAPYYFAFPQANFCQKTSYTYNSLLFETYNFSKVSSTGIESFGTSNSDMISLQFSDTRFTPLPLQYGDNYVDTYQTTTNPNPYTSNDTYDAYGTLTTPYGTFTNVVRLKQVGSSITVYNWMRASPYIQLMVIRVDNATGQIVSAAVIQNTTTLGVNQNSATNKIIAYPNPAATYLNLQLPDNQIADRVIITDVMGKILFTETNSNRMNIENLAAGSYLVQAQLGTITCQTKFVKQ